MVKCKNCKYHENGKCKFNPPVVVSANPSFTDSVYIQPTVDGNDKCGQGVAE